MITLLNFTRQRRNEAIKLLETSVLSLGPLMLYGITAKMLAHSGGGIIMTLVMTVLGAAAGARVKIRNF